MNRLMVKVTNLLKREGAEKEIKGAKAFSPLKKALETLEFANKVHFDFRAINIGLGILVEGKVQGKIFLNCSRCLERFVAPFKLEIKEIYSKPFSSLNKGEGFDIIDEKIDLGPLMEQSFLLAIPMKPLCHQNCKGLCPHCGKNLKEGPCDCPSDKIDLRLAKLEEFLKKEQE